MYNLASALVVVIHFFSLTLINIDNIVFFDKTFDILILRESILFQRIKVTIHVARRTFAIHTIEVGAPLFVR